MTTVHFNSRAYIDAIQNKLNTANQTLANYIHINNMVDNAKWNFTEMYRLIAIVKRLENDVYAAEYEDDQRRTW